MVDKSEITCTDIFSQTYLDGRLHVSIHPKQLHPDGKSIGHIILTTDDPQKRSIDGSYPIAISISKAEILTKQSHGDSSADSSFSSFAKKGRNRGVSFLTRQNELRLNFLPEKNAFESDMWISTPWGDVKEKIKYPTGFKHSLHETFECMIYAFIIAIVVRTFFVGAFFIPSQSMENTLYIGDRLVANKLIYFLRNPHRQEVVIFRTYAPKERMGRFHLQDSPHFDPTRNLRESDYYKSAYQLVSSIVDPAFKDRVEVKDKALYVGNLLIGFPEYDNEKGVISIDGESFANGRLESDTAILPDQVLGLLHIDGNHLVLMVGDKRFELGDIDVYYPLGNPALVHYREQSRENPVLNGFKSLFFTVIGRRPALIVGENQVLGNLVFINGGWTIFNRKLDLSLRGRPMRFSLPYQGYDGQNVELGQLCVDNGRIVLKDNDKILNAFGKLVLRDDVVFINDELFGFVGRTSDGFTVNGMSLTQLWEMRDFIKRCIALPGDEIVVDNGKVSVNGNALFEPYVASENMRYDDFGPFQVPEGFYFMMGDNRNNSKDSRIIGGIPRQNIVGKAMLVFWPLSRIKSIPQ